MRRLQTAAGKSHFPLRRCSCSFIFQGLRLLRAYLHQRHLRAKRQQDFLRFGGIGVVSMLVEPLLQRPRHVLQGLALVSHFTPAGTTPIEREKKKTLS